MANEIRPTQGIDAWQPRPGGSGNERDPDSPGYDPRGARARRKKKREEKKEEKQERPAGSEREESEREKPAPDDASRDRGTPPAPEGGVEPENGEEGVPHVDIRVAPPGVFRVKRAFETRGKEWRSVPLEPGLSPPSAPASDGMPLALFIARRVESAPNA